MTLKRWTGPACQQQQGAAPLSCPRTELIKKHTLPPPTPPPCTRPILLLYWFILFFVTMKRQIMHMVKYRYVPFSLGKKVRCRTVLCRALYAAQCCGGQRCV